MYKMIEVNNNIIIDFIVVPVIIMLHWSLSESSGHFWKPSEFNNVENPYFGNIKHLQNPGNLLLTAPSIPT